jgi:hypothetical protein
MTDLSAETPKSETKPRGKRAASEQSRRRRRGDNDATLGLKLGVQFELDPNYEYRWINEGIDGSRLHAKTVKDDWDTLSETGEPSDSEGGVIRRAVGETKSGPVYAYLCRKPRDLYEEDMAKRQKHNDKLMNEVKQGPVKDGPGLKATDNAYVPAEGISVGGASYKP